MSILVKELVNEIETIINKKKIYIIGYGAFTDYYDKNNHIVIANNEEEAFEMWRDKVYEKNEEVYKVLTYEAYNDDNIDYEKYGELLDNNCGLKLNIEEMGECPVSEEFNMATG